MENKLCKHDFGSNYDSEYCANGCGETWSLFTINELKSDLAACEARLESANAEIKEIEAAAKALNFLVATRTSERDFFSGKYIEAKEENAKLRAALNKVGMLGASEHAYTSEFTTKVVGIVRGALK